MHMAKPFADRLWIQTALLIAALIPVTVCAWYLETRTFNGINLWIKPLKFQTSGVLHLVTLFAAASLMVETARRRYVLVGLVGLSSIATMFEIGFISLRASQGDASHYNISTPMNSLLYGLMGIGAVSMLLPSFYLGGRFLFSKQGFKGGPGLHFGIAAGFLIGSALTLLFASYMSSVGSHWTSGQTSDVNGLWLFGWSQTGGDLRPAHFFALHLMQLAPLAGWLGDKLFADRPRYGFVLVLLSVVVFGGLSVFTFLQALRGEVFLLLS